MSDFYFKDIFMSNLNDAKSLYKYNMTKEVESYLTKIYVDDFLVPSERSQNDSINTLIFLNSLPETSETLKYLKFNGDYYFSIGGYAPEAFCNKKIAFDYFISVGRYSYFRLHQRLPKDTLYKTLAYDYMQLLLIINQVFDSIKTNKNVQILSALKAWDDTKHPIFEKKLIRMGMNMVDLTRQGISC